MKNKVTSLTITAQPTVSAGINPKHVRIGFMGADRSAMNLALGNQRAGEFIGRPLGVGIDRTAMFLLRGSFAIFGVASLLTGFVSFINVFEEPKSGGIGLGIGAGMLAVSIGSIALDAWRDSSDIPAFMENRFDETELAIDRNMFKFFNKIEPLSKEKFFKILNRTSPIKILDVVKVISKSTHLFFDKEVVLAAVTKDGSALRYASEELRADKEVLLSAMNQNLESIEYASNKFPFDQQIYDTLLSGLKSMKYYSSRFLSKVPKAYMSKEVESEISRINTEIEEWEVLIVREATEREQEAYEASRSARCLFPGYSNSQIYDMSDAEYEQVSSADYSHRGGASDKSTCYMGGK